MGKKKLRCPVCGFQRLVDANEKITIENAPKAFEDKKNELQQLQQCIV